MAVPSSTETSSAGATSGDASGDEISLNVARKGTNEIYFVHIASSLSAHRNVMATLQGYTDARVVPITRECIAGILDDKVRTDLFRALEYALEYVATRTDLDPAGKGALTIEVCQHAIAQVYSFLDEFIGLAKTNALVPMCSEPNIKDREAALRIIKDSDDMPDLDGAPIESEIPMNMGGETE